MRARLLPILAALMLPSEGMAASGCLIAQEAVFAGDGERVRLARKPGLASGANLALFRARLAVNTDGAPTSYHPRDFLGERLAINKIENGITISRVDGTTLTSAQRKEVFDLWRASPDWTVPKGYRIAWGNVIAPAPGGRPCIFSQGQYRGYFGSLTATRNGLKPAEAGECLVNDQLDQRFVPALVLRGPSVNPLARFGARKGDLVVAVNPAANPPIVVAAIIGDTGNAKRIGEGSVALNMKLLGVARQPATYREAVRLDTGARQMIVAVMPGSHAYRPAKPYSAHNIAERAQTWAREKGYGSLAGLADTLASCAANL